MAKSIHSKKAKERKPRVHIAYEVYTGDAKELKELPFVLGVMANLSGHGAKDLPALKERTFEEVSKFTFNKFLSSVKPRLTFQVDNKLSDEKDAKIPVQLAFSDMKDFEPEGVARQIRPLNDLLNIRTNLADLKRRATTNEDVAQLLQNIIDNEDARKAIADKLGDRDAGPVAGSADEATAEGGD